MSRGRGREIRAPSVKSRYREIVSVGGLRFCGCQNPPMPVVFLRSKAPAFYRGPRCRLIGTTFTVSSNLLHPRGTKTGP